jgi:hypothetical protein
VQIEDDLRTIATASEEPRQANWMVRVRCSGQGAAVAVMGSRRAAVETEINGAGGSVGDQGAPVVMGINGAQGSKRAAVVLGINGMAVLLEIGGGEQAMDTGIKGATVWGRPRARKPHRRTVRVNCGVKMQNVRC